MVVIVVVMAVGALENMVSNEQLDYVSFFPLGFSDVPAMIDVPHPCGRSGCTVRIVSG